MGRPAAPTRSDKKSAKPKRPPAAAFLVLLLILFFLGAALLGRQAGRIAGDFVEQALGEGSSVSRVEFAGPARLRIVGFESPGLSADEVVLQLSLTKAFTGGITSALRGIELVGLCVDVERLLASAGGAASGAGLPESDAAAVLALLPPEVRVRDAALLSQGEIVLEGIAGALARGEGVYRFEVEGAWAGGAAFAARGELSTGEGGDYARARGEAALRGVALGGVRAEEASFDFSLALQPPGSAQGWRAELELRSGRGEVYGFPFSSAHGEAVGGPDGWEIPGLQLEGEGSGRLRASGSVAGTDLLLDLSIEGEGVPVRSLLGWIADDGALLEGAAGSIDGRLTIAGVPGALQVRGFFKSPWVRVQDAVLTQIEVELARNPQGGVSARAGAAAGGGFVRFDLLSWSDEGVRGRLELDEVGAPALVRAAQAYGVQAAPLGRLAGRVNGRLDLRGRPGALEVSWSLESGRLRWGGVPLEPVQVEGRWSAGEWEIRRAAALGGAGGPLLTGEASGRGERATASIQLREVPVEWLRELADLPLPPGLSGTAGGVLVVTRDGEGVRVSGEASLRGEAMGRPVEGEATGSATFGGEWQIRGELRAGGGRAWIAGSGSAPGAAQLDGGLERFPADVAAGFWHVASVEGLLDAGATWRRPPGEEGWRLDARLASARLEAAGVRLSGAELSVDLEGRPAAGDGAGACASCISGTALLTADLQVPGAARGEPFAISAQFLGDRVELAPASLELWGGRAALEGSALLEGGTWQLDLRSAGERIALRSGGIAADLGYRLELAGPLGSLRLSGEVDVTEGSVDLLGLGRRPAAGTGLPLTFDVAVRLHTVRVQARSLLDGELAGELALRGSTSRPALQGELAVLRANFWYLGSRFEAGDGALTFPGYGIIPALSLTGVLRKPGTTVYARVDGPVESLQIALSSDPPLEERELLELIGVPTQWSLDETGGWTGLAQALAAWVDRELVSGVAWRLGTALERAFDLDRLRIEAGDESGARLVLGKYVRPGLYVTYDWELSSGSTRGVGLEYTLTPRLRLRSSWRPGNGTEAGVAASISF